MRTLRRRGWTLPEMLISMIITTVLLVLTTQLALGQLRYFQGISALIGMRAQIGHASTIAARALWSVSPTGGDIAIALDSAIEFQSTIGSGVACGGFAGIVTVPHPSATHGNTLSAFWDAPQVGDRVHVFFADSVGAGWLGLHVGAPPIPGPACAKLGGTDATWLVALREPIAIPEGAPLRFARAARLSLYTASDGRWYLGARDWNNDAGRFNTIQPVAGPLRPYSENPSKTGLLFVYRDASGTQLPPPADGARIASITVTSRSETDAPVRVRGLISAPDGRYADSASITIALRNAQ